MRKLHLILVLTILCMTGCAEKYPIMPAIKYSKPIDFHIKTQAYLYWLEGKHHSAVVYSKIDMNDSLGAALGDYLSLKEEAPKIKVYSSYGKAEQVIFITSLRDILVSNKVFSTVEIINNPKNVAMNFPVININFKSTKHSIDKITVVVELDIAYVKSHFKRTYLVESEPNTTSIREQQISVSEKLIDKIISAIREWENIKQEGK